MNFVVEQMTADDWERVRLIYEEGIATGQATFETAAPTWETWEAGHLSIGRLVARADGVVVGWAALSPVSGRCVYAGVAEVSVYVTAVARGQGVGKALLNGLIQASENENIWTLQASMFPENSASIALHEACGFRQVGRRERIGQLDGAWRDTLLLERRSPVVGVEPKTSDEAAPEVAIIILMGVAGAGKATVGESLAQELGWVFYDGSDFHPQANLDKIKAGIALTDADRRPWLEALHELIGDHLQGGKQAVISCSALKQSYRSLLLRGNEGTHFVYLKANENLIRTRLRERLDNLIRTDVTKNQFEALEEPEGVLAIDASESIASIIKQIREHFSL